MLKFLLPSNVHSRLSLWQLLHTPRERIHPSPGPGTSSKNSQLRTVGMGSLTEKSVRVCTCLSPLKIEDPRGHNAI